MAMLIAGCTAVESPPPTAPASPAVVKAKSVPAAKPLTAAEKKELAKEEKIRKALEAKRAAEEARQARIEEERAAAAAREAEPQWRTIEKYSGSSIKNTPTFEVTAPEFRITWKTRPGQYGDMNFQIFVYHEDGSLKDLAANIIGAGEDSTIIRGAGRYYLQFNTAQPYAVVIEEYR